MADYYPLLARAVAALPNSTPQARASIYDRARKALLGQLRTLDPPVSEEHVRSESSALDDAIERLESDLANEATSAAVAKEAAKSAIAASGASTPESANADSAKSESTKSESTRSESAKPEPTELEPKPEDARPEPPQPVPATPGPAQLDASPGVRPPAPPPMAPAAAPRPAPPSATAGAPPPLRPAPPPPRPGAAPPLKPVPPPPPRGAAAAGLKPIPPPPGSLAPPPLPAGPAGPERTSVAGGAAPAGLGAAGAMAASAVAREALRDGPGPVQRESLAAPSGKPDPRLETARPGQPRPDFGEAGDEADGLTLAPPRGRDSDVAREAAVAARVPKGAARTETSHPAAPVPPPPRGGVPRQLLVWIPLILTIAGVIGFAAWSLRVPQDEFARPRAVQANGDQTKGSAKINERADGPGSSAAPAQQAQAARQPNGAQPDSRQARPQTAQPQGEPAQTQQQQAPPATRAGQQEPAQQLAPVAQRSAILVQAAVNDQQNVETHVGTTVWRLEESRRPGAAGSPALRADVEIPAVGMRMVFLIEKNKDPTLRASHMLTFRFLSQGSTLPPVAEMGSPQMRNESAPAVEPLAGAQAKITDRIYIVALNADPTFAARNLETMKSRGWFDFPIRLNDGRIAKITIEKGAPGDRLLNQALEQWQR